ncbi:MAG: ATP-dependent Clp protease ATP-binding subunit [Patescibacteria group bacterium]
MTQTHFKDPRLKLTTGGEFLTRLVTYSAYVLGTSATFFLIFSGAKSLEALGFLMALFLADRLIHFGEGEKNLAELKDEKINLASVVTPAAYRILDHSFRKAMAVEENFYLIILKELIDRRDIKEALRRLDVNSEDLSEKIESSFQKTAKKYDRQELLVVIESLVIKAYESALNVNERYIEPRSLFIALVTVNDPLIQRIFELFNLEVLDVQEAVIFGRWRRLFAGVRRLPAVLGGFAHRPNFLRHRVMNRAWTARPTPILDQFSTDLTDLARNEKIGLLVGHDKEFNHLLDIISRPGKPNALLVGEAGVGKSTMIAHLAFRMVKDEVPPVLFDKRLVSLEVGDLVANAAPEALAGRLQKIVEEIITAGNIVLFIPNTHDLFRTADTKKMNAIDILLPVIKSEAIPLIGESYPREFKQFIQSRSDFLEQFEVVTVDEVSEAEALRFLIYNSLIFEREFKVFITFRALKKSIEVAHRYFRTKPLPGSAVDLLKQAVGRAKQDRLKAVQENLIVEVAERQSKIPIEKAGGMEAEKLLNLEATIHKRLVNQELAVKAVSRALREYRSGLSRSGGPIATFLFVGPTGVGKTELAKILAQTQFGSKENMHRFDMSEYQDKQSIFRFIGTPDGEKSGALTDAVMANPYSLVLLDEFEKAHPDILNLFLQVFDDGRLTDSLGRTVDFTNAIIIATSNAHSEFIKEEIEKGRSSDEVGEELKKKLTDYFKPELINRFSEVIVFRNLNEAEIHTITKFLIKDVSDVLAETHGIELAVDEAAVKKIAELGFSPVFGARPLRQVISEKIKGVLADKILRREISRGNKINFVLENNDFQFNITE